MLDPLSLSIELPSTPQRPTLPARKLLTLSSTHPDDYILELDYSSLSKIIECPRAAENYLIHSREAATDGSATSFGKLFHSCEELRLLHGLTPEVITRQRELVSTHFLNHFTSPSDHRTAERMLDVLNKYNKMYSLDGWPDKTLTQETLEGGSDKLVERSFKVELCTIPITGIIPYDKTKLIANATNEVDVNNVTGGFYVRHLHIVFTGRIDAIITDSNLLWVVDHKTSSRGGKEFEDAFRLSLQTKGYVWAAQKLLNLPIAGLIMNGIIIRPLTKTGTGTEFSRHSYFYSADSISEWETNAIAIIHNFVSMLVFGYFPQHSRSFKSPCAGCSYQDNCSLPRHQRAADLSTDFFRDVTWSPINE